MKIGFMTISLFIAGILLLVLAHYLGEDQSTDAIVAHCAGTLMMIGGIISILCGALACSMQDKEGFS